LMGKDIIIVNQGQMLYVFGHLMFMVASLGMLVFQQDVLMLIFVLTFSNILLIMGAMSAKSPYSKIGAQREIMQMMAYEPVLLLMVIGIYIVDRSFMIKDIFKLDNGKPLVFSLPLIFMAFLFILTIKLRKSPFDFSTSHHGHQELIKGLTIEFSGPQLSLIELAHWYELVLIMGLISLFYARPIWIGILLAFICFFIEILIDNINARVTWKWMIKVTWVVGISFSMLNIFWLYIIG